MTIPANATPTDLDRIRILNGENQTVGFIGLTMVLYVKGPWDAGRRSAFADMIDRHLDAVRDHLRWILLPESGRYQDVRAMGARPINDRIARLTSDEPFSIEAHGGETPEEAGSYAIDAMVPYPRRRRLGFVRLGLPLSWLAERSGGSFQSLVGQWCAAVKPLHGCAGLGLVHNPNFAFARAAGPSLFPFLSRFPGLDFDDPVASIRLCGDGIRSTNWLTVVADDLIDRVGGQAALRSFLDPQDFPLSAWNGGITIQAGEAPSLGDLDRGIVPECYRSVARFLKPLQAAYGEAIISTPPGVDGREFTASWLGRFG